MGRVETNLPDVVDDLRRRVAAVSMRSPGRYGTVGEDVVEAVAQTIIDRTILQQKRPDGRPLARLARSTQARKARKGLSPLILVATGKMLSRRELKGEPAIDERSVTITFGVTPRARELMDWATRGDRRRDRPPRPSFELGADGERAVDEVVEAGLDRVFTDAGGSPEGG